MKTNRLPYETIAMQAEKLFDKVVAANQEEILQRYKDYVDYLEACGWSINAYDDEQLKRINQGNSKLN